MVLCLHHILTLTNVANSVFPLFCQVRIVPTFRSYFRCLRFFFSNLYTAQLGSLSQKFNQIWVLKIKVPMNLVKSLTCKIVKCLHNSWQISKMPRVFDLIVFSLLKREFNVQSILLESKVCWGFVLICANC